MFYEIVIAPGYTPDGLEILKVGPARPPARPPACLPARPPA